MRAVACSLLTLVACRAPATAPERATAPGPALAGAPTSLDVPRAVPEVGAAAEPGTSLAADWEELARSVEQRPIRVRTVGHGPRRVLWIGGIHGNEREGRQATAALPEAFLGTPGAAERVTLTLVEDANPDGSAADRRHNAHGVDLNRNFPAANFRERAARHGRTPLSQPETRALHDLVVRLQPDLVLVAHSWPGQRFINYDGPALALAQRFAERSGWPLRESGDFHATPGSLGSWVGLTLGRPILTLEFRRGQDPREGWEETRAAILEALLEEASVGR